MSTHTIYTIGLSELSSFGVEHYLERQTKSIITDEVKVGLVESPFETGVNSEHKRHKNGVGPVHHSALE